LQRERLCLQTGDGGVQRIENTHDLSPTHALAGRKDDACDPLSGSAAASHVPGVFAHEFSRLRLLPGTPAGTDMPRDRQKLPGCRRRR
jgi:hypothetical protein